jgi:hypothetical protein
MNGIFSITSQPPPPFTSPNNQQQVSEELFFLRTFLKSSSMNICRTGFLVKKTGMLNALSESWKLESNA